jgi:plastocyanin
MRKLITASIAAITIIALAGGAAASVNAKKPKLSGSVDNKGTAKAVDGAIEIALGDFFFDKTFIKAKAGETVTVTLDNESSTQHTFTIDKQDIDETLDVGDTFTVEVKLPANGKPVVGYCRFHKGSGMQFAFFSKAGKAGKKAKPADTTDDTSSPGGYGY